MISRIRDNWKRRSGRKFGPLKKRHVKRIGKLLGFKDKAASSLLKERPYEELLYGAQLYNLVRMRIGLKHSEMRQFLRERNGTTLEEIAAALKISLEGDVMRSKKSQCYKAN